MFWFESNQMTVTGGVDVVADQSGNGRNLVYATAATYQAAGGPTGGPAWLLDQNGVITGASLANTPARSPQTFYVVYFPPAGSANYSALNSSPTTNNQIRIAEVFTLRRASIYDYSYYARSTALAAWTAGRWRGNADPLSGVKLTGVGEVTAAHEPFTTGTHYWSTVPSGSSSPCVLIAGFDEDTLVTGVDAQVQAHILANYGLAL
jgi:hypothetical protein